MNTKKELGAKGIKPIKHRGQNFLISKNIISKIIAAAQIKPSEIILEVGPGTGNLTRTLLEVGASVIAVEKDRELTALLKLKMKNEKLRIIEGDILKFDESLIKKPYRIIANIPYYLTGKLIQKFLLSNDRPVEMILMVQKEVGERIAARPPKANYLSSLVGFLAKAEILFRVGQENFWPKPKVDSVMVKIVPRPTAAEVDTNEFIVFLRKIFKQPRQTLFNNLVKNGFSRPTTEKLFQDFNLPKNTRAQTLSVSELVKMFQSIMV